MSYRPRGALARALFEKLHNDTDLDTIDMQFWYKLYKSLPERYQSKFVNFEPDHILLDWLDRAKRLSASLWLQVWHTIARMFLSAFMTQTDVNGWLKRGSMFVLSECQFQHLLNLGGFNLDNFGNNTVIDILDIGAGDGEVTKRLAKSVIQMKNDIMLKVYVTESSWTMRDRLKENKFTVVEKIGDLRNIHLISCLNVLDRCFDPYQILQDMYDALAPNGRVIIALVLPYSHYVESNSSHLPLKSLLPHWPEKQGIVTFDEEATVFFNVLEETGFNIEAWTKAPYLCEGDLRQSFYWLIDVVVLLSKK